MFKMHKHWTEAIQKDDAIAWLYHGKRKDGIVLEPYNHDTESFRVQVNDGLNFFVSKQDVIEWERPAPKPNRDETILEEALRITGGDRQNQYGPPDQDFRRIAGMWNALFADFLKEGHQFEPSHVAQAMILVKMSRQLHQKKRDNWVDTAGYSRCGSQCDGSGS